MKLSLIIWIFILLSSIYSYRFAYRTFISFPFDPELGIVEKRTIPNGDSTPVLPVVIIGKNIFTFRLVFLAFYNLYFF